MGDKKAFEVGTRLYLNGFPKSGTHALAVLASMMLKRASDKNNWAGNIGQCAFGKPEEERLQKALRVFDVFPPNVYIKGHMAYDERVARAIQKNKVASVFIFRDFRDVAVSATFHAGEGEGFSFPTKWFYRALDFDDRLKFIITGDEFIRGVMDRWEDYAPWLEEDWVLKVAYEDYIEHTEEMVELFIRYVYGKTANYYGLDITLDKDDFDMVKHRLMEGANHPEMSPTYREGKTGKWREYFTKEHKELFKESDKNNWLIRLGYENDTNW